MSEIRTTKIDGQEFVPYKDYLRLKEEKEKIKLLFKTRKSEGNNACQVGKRFVRIYGEIGNKPMVELESFQIVVKQNQKLEEENKKLKEKLEHIKETYIRFEDSEKEYNKGLGELDQLIMNR